MLVSIDELDALKAQHTRVSTSDTRDPGWTAAPDAFLRLTCPRREFAPAEWTEADRCRDQLSHLGRCAGRSESRQLGLPCLRCTSPYTALTGQPVGQLRGGPARAFDVESAPSWLWDRFTYLTCTYGS